MRCISTLLCVACCYSYVLRCCVYFVVACEERLCLFFNSCFEVEHPLYDAVVFLNFRGEVVYLGIRDSLRLGVLNVYRDKRYRNGRRSSYESSNDCFHWTA